MEADYRKEDFAIVEIFYKKSLKTLLMDLYCKEGFSCPQIAEIWQKEVGVLIEYRNILRWVTKFKFNRAQPKSMRTRVVSGRVDYEKIRLKTDYTARNIDYAEVARKRSPDYNGPLKHPKQKIVYLPEPYILKIKQYASQHNKTITEILKEIFVSRINIYNYKTFAMQPISNSQKPYSYKKRELLDALDAYLKS